MDEFGVYQWQDGRRYEGFYKDDKKHGYGLYTWSDQKKYAGFWHGGKQHGVGVFISKDNKVKYGVWEDGKKVKWLNKEDVIGIESGEVEFRGIFANEEESLLKMSEFPLQF